MKIAAANITMITTPTTAASRLCRPGGEFPKNLTHTAKKTQMATNNTNAVNKLITPFLF